MGRHWLVSARGGRLEGWTENRWAVHKFRIKRYAIDIGPTGSPSLAIHASVASWKRVCVYKAKGPHRHPTTALPLPDTVVPDLPMMDDRDDFHQSLADVVQGRRPGPGEQGPVLTPAARRKATRQTPRDQHKTGCGDPVHGLFRERRLAR